MNPPVLTHTVFVIVESLLRHYVIGSARCCGGSLLSRLAWIISGVSFKTVLHFKVGHLGVSEPTGKPKYEADLKCPIPVYPKVGCRKQETMRHQFKLEQCLGVAQGTPKRS